MTLISVNTGRPREVLANGEVVRTSIWKSPREGRVRAAGVNLDGDEQSDLTVHGGQYKSVYVYPSEHYAYWTDQLPSVELPWGVFGENLTTEGLLETDVCIGDRIAIGSAEFQVTQPRQPCFKLGIRFGRDDMLKRFVASGRSGFYVSIVAEGDVGRGDTIRVTHRESGSVSVSDIFALKMRSAASPDALKHAASIEGLTPSWREHFLARLSTR
jgi:MOSC domain-containing protein YiiM